MATVDHLSWWCNLSWEEFHDAVMARVPGWKCQKPSALDYVGATLQRDTWEPRRDPPRTDAGNLR